ncbi:MAG TPA: hypothetical protein VJ204_03925 [Solirubrobacterales bacterium]|nr:hypothetical protein [Solirubrobacterales bacterium]
MSVKKIEPPVLPELEQMLIATAARNVRRSPGGRRFRIPTGRIPRLVAVAATCLAIGGTAVAATGVWNPIVGHTGGPETLSGTPVPTAMTELLGVLRREQTPRDRSPEVEATLDGADVPGGVRLESVRYLGPGADGKATVLFSGVEAGPFDREGEPACVARPLPGESRPIFVCFDLGELRSGRAYVSSVDGGGENLVDGIVPDGVATVTAIFSGAPPVEVPVHDNYWELTLDRPEAANPDGESGVIRTVWRDAEGNVIPRAEPHG